MNLKSFPAFFAKPYRFKKVLQFRLYLDFLLRLNVLLRTIQWPNMSANCIEDTRMLRSTPSTCGGKLRKLSASKARECGYRIEISICLSHFNKLSSINSTFCCYPCLEENTCSGVLKECPQRLLQTFDELGTKTGTKICQKHLSDADRNPLITCHASYKEPGKRKVRMHLCSVYI